MKITKYPQIITFYRLGHIAPLFNLLIKGTRMGIFLYGDVPVMKIHMVCRALLQDLCQISADSYILMQISFFLNSKSAET